MNQWVRRIYPYILLVPAVLPLVYLDGLMYPMLTLKTLLLRGLGIAALALFVYLVSTRHPFYWDRLKNWQTWIPAALLGVAYLTSLFGVDFYRSFWSTFERGDGLLTLTACVAFFYLILLFANREFVGKLMRLVGWVGAIAGIYVCVQWLFITLGIDLPLIAKTSGRIGGTLGNAAFLAAYLGMSLPITYLVAREYLGWQRTLLYIGAGCELLGIFFAATRGTILALIIVGTLVLLHEALRRGSQYQKPARYALGVLALGVLIFIFFREPLSRAPIEPVRRLASVSLTDSTVASRLFLWKSLLPEAMESPVLGVGAEHVSVLFNRVYDPTLIVEEWFDRSHNAYLDYLIQYGFVGLALYLALIVTALLTAWRLSRDTARAGTDLAGSLLFLVLSIYALQNIFVFDTGVTLLLLLALCAILVALSDKSVPLTLALPLWSGYGGLVVGAALLTLLVPVVITPLRANRLAFDAYLYHVADVGRTAEDTMRGLALKTYADLEFGYNAYFMLTEEQLTMLKGADLEQAYQTARETLEANFSHYSYDARTAVYLAHVLDSAPPGVTPDYELLREVLAQAITLSPKRREIWFILANISIAKASAGSEEEKGRYYDEAESILKSYIKLVPQLSEPHYILADLALARGDKSTAAQEAALGKELYTPNLFTAKRAAIHYIKIEDWGSAVFFLEQIVTEEPLAYSWHYDLAKVLYLLGRFEESLRITTYLRTTSPTTLKTDPEFLRAITDYEKSR